MPGIALGTPDSLVEPWFSAAIPITKPPQTSNRGNFRFFFKIDILPVTSNRKHVNFLRLPASLPPTSNRSSSVQIICSYAWPTTEYEMYNVCNKNKKYKLNVECNKNRKTGNGSKIRTCSQKRKNKAEQEGIYQIYLSYQEKQPTSKQVLVVPVPPQVNFSVYIKGTSSLEVIYKVSKSLLFAGFGLSPCNFSRNVSPRYASRPQSHPASDNITGHGMQACQSRFTESPYIPKHLSPP